MEGALARRLMREYDRDTVSPPLVEGLERFLGSICSDGVLDPSLLSPHSPVDIKRLLKKGYQAYLAESTRFRAHLPVLLELGLEGVELLETRRDTFGFDEADYKLQAHLCGDIGDVAHYLHEETEDIECGLICYDAWKDAAAMTEKSDADYAFLARSKAANAAERVYKGTNLSSWRAKQCEYLLLNADVFSARRDPRAFAMYTYVSQIADSQFKQAHEPFWAQVSYESAKDALESEVSGDPRVLADANLRLSFTAMRLMSVGHASDDVVKEWHGGMQESARQCESFDRIIAAKRYADAGGIALETCAGYDKSKRQVVSWLEKGYSSYSTSLKRFSEIGLDDMVISQRYAIADVCSRIVDMTTDNKRKKKWRDKGWVHADAVRRYCGREGYPEYISSTKLNTLLRKLESREKR